MKKNIFKKSLTFILIIMCLCSVLLTGCGETETEITVDSIEISKKNIYLAEGQTTVLTAQVFPFNANNQEVVWQSSNENVVRIEDGFVTAIKAGEAVIEVVSEDGGYKDTCNVLVTTARDNLALNDYNNLNMPQKELEPIYQPQAAKNNNKNNYTKTHKVNNTSPVLKLATKIDEEAKQGVGSAKNVLADIKTELMNSISSIQSEKANLKEFLYGTGEEYKNSVLNCFNEIRYDILNSMENIKTDMLNTIEYAEKNCNTEEYKVDRQDMNGVTFVVISSK